MPDAPAIWRLVDSHVHFWDRANLNYDWLSEAPAIDRPFLPADLASAAGGVPLEKIVFVQAGGDASEFLREAEWVSALSAAEPRIAGIVAYVPLEEGAAHAALEALARLPLVKGVRRNIQSEGLDFATRPEFVRGVRRLADYGFSFDICIYHRHMGSVVTLVQNCPEVRFVLDHIGKPGIKAHLVEPWAAQIKQLAALPNVWCKLSGLVTEADITAWTPDDLGPYIETVLEAFGPERLMFGSDWPVATLGVTYTRWVDVASTALAGLGDDDRDNIFYGNASTFYRLDR